MERAIKESKSRSFRRLCDEANLDPWGIAYRVVMTKLKGNRGPQLICPAILRTIVEHLFPQISMQHILAITSEELS